MADCHGVVGEHIVDGVGIVHRHYCIGYLALDVDLRGASAAYDEALAAFEITVLE